MSPQRCINGRDATIGKPVYEWMCNRSTCFICGKKRSARVLRTRGIHSGDKWTYYSQNYGQTCVWKAIHRYWYCKSCYGEWSIYKSIWEGPFIIVTKKSQRPMEIIAKVIGETKKMESD